MVGVCFHYEEYDSDVFSGRPVILDAWNYAISAAGDVTEVCIINKTAQTLKFNEKFDLKVFGTCQEFLEYSKSRKVTNVVAPGEVDQPTSLWEFDHVTDFYLFGSTADRLSGGGIIIPTAGVAAFHPVHAATVVLSHRFGVHNGNFPSR